MTPPLVVKVDRDVCVGNAMCVELAPHTFGLNDEGQAHVIGSDADPATLIHEAVANCPVGAITVERAE